MTDDLEKQFLNKERDKVLNYDKKQHFELLNKQGDGGNSELLTHQVIQIHHLNWEIRDQYLELLENYREKKIDTSNFRIKFDERYRSIEKVADFLESNRVFLSPDKNSCDFGYLLSDIDTYSEAYSNDPEPYRTKFDIGESEFRSLMEDIYLEIQKCLNEE